MLIKLPPTFRSISEKLFVCFFEGFDIAGGFATFLEDFDSFCPCIRSL